MFIPGLIPQNNLVPPDIKSYHSENEEMAAITNRIYSLVRENTDPVKIAILYQNETYCEQLEAHFKIKKIAFYSRRNINILENPFINKIIQLLCYISSEHDMPFSGDYLLFEILHYDLFEIPTVEIAKLAIETNKKKGNNTIHNIRKLLLQKVHAPAKDLFDTGINKELKNVSLVLEKLIAAVPHVSLHQLFKSITDIADIQNYISRSDESVFLLQLVAALADFIDEQITCNADLQLTRLAAIIVTMQKEHIPITVSKLAGCPDNVHLIEATADTEIKFDYIFIAGCTALPKKKHSPPYYYFKPAEINFSSLTVNDAEQHGIVTNCYSCLKYASHLFISFVKYDNHGKESAPPPLIKEITSNLSITIKSVKLIDAELEEYSVLHKFSFPEIKHLDEAIITPILNKFVMNVSALNNYLNCPLGFYYKNIIRSPTRKNEAMEFGSAVHYSLEKLFIKIIRGSSSNSQSSKPGEFTSTIELVEDFNQYMQSRRAYFTNEAFERRLKYGAEILPNYYNHYAQRWNKIVSVERNISGIIINGVPVKGKIDKLEFNGKEVTIVDYKTGDIEKALLKMKSPDNDNPNGGDYWRQAIFYKMLIDNYEQKGWKVISVEFDFIEPDKDNQYRKEKIQIGQPDIETVKHQISEVWAKIQAREFYVGCGRPDCHWCNFVKNNKPAIDRPITKKVTTTD